MLAEAKVEAVHLLVRGLAEYSPKIAKSTHLEQKPGATLQSAQDLDRNTREFNESARHYFTVYETSMSPKKKAEAVICLSQELINAGSFRQAREFLKRSKALALELTPRDRTLLQAQAEGKLGWIADYELGFSEELVRFKRSRDILEEIPEESWGAKEKELYSTSYHFSGRARVGLADAGVDREANINLAKECFINARHLDEELDVPTINEKVGHGYAWEGRCYLRSRETGLAKDAIQKALDHFFRHHDQFPQAQIMAHYHMLIGEAYLWWEDYLRARGNFQKAVEIRGGGKGIYPKDTADALGGIAAAYWKEGKIKRAAPYFIKAVRANPKILFKGLLGG